MEDYRCRACGKVFNVFTGTALHGARFSPARLVMILRGFVQGVPTLHLAQELDISRRHLLTVRHRVQALALERFPPSALPDRVVEADEMYQNAGEKGRRHPDPADPPRRRANKFNGHGTFDNDRPPILGVIGRESGEVRLRQVYRSTVKAIEPVVLRVTAPGTAVHTDEWHAYDDLDDRGRTRFSVNHHRKEWARDDDEDGVREVHSNTIEGLWLCLRNYLPEGGCNEFCAPHFQRDGGASRTMASAIRAELIDELLGGAKTKEAIFGPDGLIKQHTGAIVERALRAELSKPSGKYVIAGPGRRPQGCVGGSRCPTPPLRRRRAPTSAAVATA
ncbi:MAG: transposase [Polyangiales bacterium]